MFRKIRSIIVLKNIFTKLKKRKKLTLLKYNKALRDKLNISKNDYQEFQLLKELNTKFNLDIKDDEDEELDLSNKKLGKSFLAYFKKIKFNELKNLSFNENIISDLKMLENIKFEKIEILHLSSNKISDINCFEKFKFENLTELDLSCNRIHTFNMSKIRNIGIK